MEHTFTNNIKAILEDSFGEDAAVIFDNSLLLQYINLKTRSANKGSKARSSFATLYALYVIIEDYLVKGFDEENNYADYEGAAYTKLFKRQRELPFGGSLQNHALNNRTNAEFQKYFPSSTIIPIIRNLETNRYWINENLLKIKIKDIEYNLGSVIIKIIDEYVKTKQDAFQRFIKASEELQNIKNSEPQIIIDFITALLAPNTDARLFEILSYSILKFYYHDQIIYWGFTLENLNQEHLKLYKTGRTNANDGGIDFVMRPLGRFFQVTETLDFKKYFLDIDKIQKFPISFVIKSEESTDIILAKIQNKASKTYTVKAVVEKYMSCIEEIINIPILLERFNVVINLGYLNDVLKEIVIQSKLEFNYAEFDNID